MEVAKSNQKESGGFIGYIGNADGTGILKNNVSYSSGTQGYKFDGASEDTKYSAEGVSGLYSMKESRLKRESSRTGATALTKITESSVDTLSGKNFTRQWHGRKTYGILHRCRKERHRYCRMGIPI